MKKFIVKLVHKFFKKKRKERGVNVYNDLYDEYDIYVVLFRYEFIIMYDTNDKVRKYEVRKCSK